MTGKYTFAAYTFRSYTYASGHWAGTGTGVIGTPDGIFVPNAQGRIFYDKRPDRLFLNEQRKAIWRAK